MHTVQVVLSISFLTLGVVGGYATFRAPQIASYTPEVPAQATQVPLNLASARTALMRGRSMMSITPDYHVDGSLI